MWQQQPDYAQYKEKSNGEGWLVNRQEGTLIQIKPDSATQHAQFVLVSYYRLSERIGKPVRQQHKRSQYLNTYIDPRGFHNAKPKKIG